MEKDIAKLLLGIEAVFLRPQEPFTWASGIKSPIYCDNRLILSYPKERRQVEEGLASLIRVHYPECQLVAGGYYGAADGLCPRICQGSWPKQPH